MILFIDFVGNRLFLHLLSTWKKNFELQLPVHMLPMTMNLLEKSAIYSVLQGMTQMVSMQISYWNEVFHHSVFLLLVSSLSRLRMRSTESSSLTITSTSTLLVSMQVSASFVDEDRQHDKYMTFLECNAWFVRFSLPLVSLSPSFLSFLLSSLFIEDVI